MSLRAKLLLAIVAVNTLLFGVLLWLVHDANRSAVERGGDAFRQAFTREVLQGFVRSLRASRVTIEDVLAYPGFGTLCADTLVVDSREAVNGGPDADAPWIQVNPLGALQRDPERFPRQTILDGVREAMTRREALAVHGGYCMPIEAEDGRLLGGGWFLLQGAVQPSLPSLGILLAVALGAFLLSGITFVGLERWVLVPLARLSEAARALERGDASPAVPVAGAVEVQAVIQTFNRASHEMRGHQAELARAVEEATERARRRERELILSGRLAALGTLAAGIAHEINNPLGGMLNAVNRLKKAGGREKDAVYLELLEEGLDRIARIVRRTLDFAPRTREPLGFRVLDAVERARALVSHRLEKSGVTLTVTGGEEAWARGDPHELSQVFLNLFLNSLDALDSQAKPAAGQPARVLRVEIGSSTSESGEPWVRVLVADNGPGCDEATLARVLDPFFTTKDTAAEGERLSSGLGLSIASAIIDQHGGRMQITSERGQGFQVEIVLPAAEPPRARGGA